MHNGPCNGFWTFLLSFLPRETWVGLWAQPVPHVVCGEGRGWGVWTDCCSQEHVAHPKKLKCEQVVLRISMASEGASTDCPPLLFRMNAWKFGHFCALGSFPVPPPRSLSAAQMAKETSTSAWCAKGCCEYRLPTGSRCHPARAQTVLSCSDEPALGRLCLTLWCKIVVLGQTDQFVALQHTCEPSSALQLITWGDTPQGVRSKSRVKTYVDLVSCFHRWCLIGWKHLDVKQRESKMCPVQMLNTLGMSHWARPPVLVRPTALHNGEVGFEGLTFNH